jgi:signal transduction histidine kinase
LYDLIYSEDLKEFKEEFLYILEGGRNKGQEFRISSKNGNSIPMIFYMSQTQLNNVVEGVRGIIIDVSEQKKLEHKLLTAIIDTEDRERKRFAEDLHDGLGPLLSTIKLYVNQMNHSDVGEKERTEMMKFTNELLDESISNTKSIANNILPGTISDNGLVPALNSFFARINTLGHIKIHFDYKLDIRLLSSIENTLYRILNELLNNTIKHAEASNVYVDLSLNGRDLDISYRDDGKGFDLSVVERGLGLENIQSRARSIHATTAIHTEPNKGFRYELRMQINHKNNEL